MRDGNEGTKNKQKKAHEVTAGSKGKKSKKVDVRIQNLPHNECYASITWKGNYYNADALVSKRKLCTLESQNAITC